MTARSSLGPAVTPRFSVDGYRETYTLAEMRAANPHAPNLLWALARLPVGRSLVYGGGAAAEFVILRVA